MFDLGNLNLGDYVVQIEYKEGSDRFFYFQYFVVVMIFPDHYTGEVIQFGEIYDQYIPLLKYFIKPENLYGHEKFNYSKEYNESIIYCKIDKDKERHIILNKVLRAFKSLYDFASKQNEYFKYKNHNTFFKENYGRRANLFLNTYIFEGDEELSMRDQVILNELELLLNNFKK